jgi:hypothetical protein
MSEENKALACHHHWAVRMPHNGIRDAAHKEPSYPPTPPAPHRYQPHSFLSGQGDDLLRGTSLPEVSLRHGGAQALDFLYLPIEYLLSLPAHLLPYESVEVYRRHRSPDVHDVQLGVGAFGQAEGSSGSELRVAGIIGSQKDLGRKDAH